jgi:ribosomal-protein-alanine N-acetyltransferase
MNIRRANIDDLSELVRMEKENFTIPWTSEQFKYELTENQFSTTYVIYDNDKMIGYICYWIIFDQSTLNKIAVDASYRNKGIGQQLMDIFENDVKANDCIVETLEVRVHNTNAIRLYEKNGFKVVTTKRGYYQDGEDALYMVKGVING